ncbi:MAG: hypothetical protein WBC44_04330 [Planctomycetaceae bacterium]
MFRLAYGLMGLAFVAGLVRGADQPEPGSRHVAWRLPGYERIAEGIPEEAFFPEEEFDHQATKDADNDAKKASKQVRATAIWTMDVASGEVTELTSIPDYPIINSPEISPDGEWVAVDGWKAEERLTDARVFLVNLKNGAVVNLVKGCMPSWSADGKWIAFCKYGEERGVYIRSVNGAAERLIDRDGWGIQWAPNGLKAAYSRDGKFVIYDFIADSREEISTVQEWPYSSIYWNCKWSSDSKQICFLGRRADGGKDIGILDLVGEKPRLRVRGDAEKFNPDIAWHPDGSRIVLPAESRPKEPGQIYVFDPNGYKPPRRLEGQPADRANGGMCWTQGGKVLIFLSRG